MTTRGGQPAESPVERRQRIGATTIRLATREDISAIKAIADRERRTLGFVHGGALRRAVDRAEVLVAVAEDASHLVGFCQSYHRRDGTVSLYHIAVVEEARGLGIGRALVERLSATAIGTGMRSIRLKCPAELPANRFYPRLGFSLARTENGVARRLHVWERSIDPSPSAAD